MDEALRELEVRAARVVRAEKEGRLTSGAHPYLAIAIAHAGSAARCRSRERCASHIDRANRALDKIGSVS